MLLDRYAQNGHCFNSNFIEETSAKGKFAYRGDLILAGDFDVPANERRPPTLLMGQAALLADENKLIALFGALDHLSDLDKVFEVYGPDFSEKVTAMFFVRDVPTPLVLERDGQTLHLQPNDDTLLWNELLDVLAIEKSDLKKLSPSDKVVAVVEATRSFRSRAPTVDWEGALAKRVEKAPVQRAGAI